MRTITIYDKNDRVFFLKDGENVIINGTSFQFRFVREGVAITSDSDTTKVQTEYLEYEVPTDMVFATEEEAKTKAKELNKRLLDELECTLDVVKRNYL